MTAIDDAFAKYQRDIAGRQRPRYSDLEAGFKAGWKAAMLHRDSRGEQLELGAKEHDDPASLQQQLEVERRVMPKG